MADDFKNFYYLLESKEKEELDRTIDYLSKKERILLLTTSNRAKDADNTPKSTQLAQYIQRQLAGKTVTLINVPDLHIYECEGNVSNPKGNGCGKKDAVLKDKEKNPSGQHRCWCSLTHKDDELWKISKPLLEAEVVVFFGSVRWGQANAVYSRLIERLTWLENRHTTLGESNIIKDIEAGIILIGQNWNGEIVVETQKQVLKFFGFKVPAQLSWNWQFTSNAKDESKESYLKAPEAFKKEFFQS